MYGLVWLSCYLIFPGWWVQVSRELRIFVFVSYLLWFTLGLIVLWRYCLFSRPSPPGISDLRAAIDPIRKNPDLLALLLIGLLLHVYPSTLPLSSIGDEHMHAHSPLNILNRLRLFPVWLIRSLSWMSLLMLITGVSRVSRLEAWSVGARIRSLVAVLIGCVLVFFLLNERFLASQEDRILFLFRYPPLGKMVGVFWYGLFGSEPWVFRSVQALFHTGAGLQIYRIVAPRRSHAEAVLASAVFLLMPLTHYYGHASYLDMGAAFFIVTAVLHFLQFEETALPRDALILGWAVGTGFLWKDTTLPVMGVFWLVWIARGLRCRTVPPVASWVSTVLALVPILPWMAIQRLHAQRAFSPVFAHLLDPKILLTQMRLLIPCASVLVIFLLLVGIWREIRVHRDLLSVVVFVWFFLYYLLITLDDWYHLARLLLGAYPVVAIVAGSAAGCLAGRPRALVVGSICVLLAVSLAEWPVDSGLTKAHEISRFNPSSEAVFLPYDQFVAEYGSFVPPGSVIYDPLPTSAREYYLELRGLERRDVWLEDQLVIEREQTIERELNYMVAKGALFLVLPNEAAVIDGLTRYPSASLIRALEGHPAVSPLKTWVFGKYALTLYAFDSTKDPHSPGCEPG